LNVPGHTRYPGTVHGKQVIEPRQRDIGIGGNLHGSGSSGLGHESQRRAALIVIGGMGDGRRADKGKGVHVGRVHGYGDKIARPDHHRGNETNDGPASDGRAVALK
jgi:hypothetical protein